MNYMRALLAITILTILSPLARAEYYYPKKTFAFYYPWYGAPTGPSEEWVHWDTETPNIAHTPSPVFEDMGYPGGYYDSNDPLVVAQHIDWAKQAGIDGFIVSWWGQETFEDNALPVLFEVAEQKQFLLSIYYETTADEGQTFDDIAYLLDLYGDHPAFFNIEGKPVLFVYSRAIEQITLVGWQSVLGALRNAGYVLFAVGDGLNAATANVFDGIHAYSLLGRTATDIAKVYLTASLIASLKNKLFCVPVSPGYDDTAINEPGAIIDRNDGRLYSFFWEIALAAHPDCVVPTSFNEWHEGTEIEPSREYGEQYLELTAFYAALFKDM